jgi:hypothetical protein
MEHADQVQKVIATLQGIEEGSPKGALVMTYENVADHAVGEVHILTGSGKGTPYPQVLAMFVACLDGIGKATGIPMEKMLDDIDTLVESQGFSDDPGIVH